MNEKKETILHLLKKYQHQVRVKDEDASQNIMFENKFQPVMVNKFTIIKKNAFKIICHWYIGEAWLFKRNSFGGYDPKIRIEIEKLIDDFDKIMTLPEVKKTKQRFNRDLIVQNMIGREIIEKIGNGRITHLASHENGVCEISCNSFSSCCVCSQYTRIWATYPDNGLFSQSISYNISDPAFNPDLLIKVIKNFSDNINKIKSQIRAAWDEAENLWYLEAKNHESE